jgi:hypothetical protein
MDRLNKILFFLCLASGLAGCRSDGRLFPPPGSVQTQRHNATLFDPYTDVETGPEVVGGRPRDFQQPLSESERSRLFQNQWYANP